MDDPSVTVVVPAYNAEPYIADCLQSIQAQSFKDFVCQVHDDGSTDRTREIAEGFAKSDSRFQIIPGENIGTPRRVAVAYRGVTSEFFCQVDADDMIAPDALDLTMSTLSGCPQQVGVVYSDYQRINTDGTLDHDDPHFESRCRQPFSLRRMQQNGFCAFQFRLMRTDAYQACRGVDQRLPTGEDFDLVLKLAEYCQFVHIPRKLYLYRQHESQTSRKNPSHLEMLCKGMMTDSTKRKANPSFAIAIPYTGVDDVFALRRWVQQQSPVDVLFGIVVDAKDPDVLECQGYSQHRVEIIQRRKDSETDYGRLVSRMVREVPTVEFTEALVPSPGVLSDVIAGKSIPIFTLEPRSSWLLQSGGLQFDVVKHLTQDSTEFVGDGPPGDSALYRLTREEAYRG